MRNTTEQCIRIGEVEGENLIELSVSKVKTWAGCQQKYHYKYNEELRPRRKAVPLRRGSWVHDCLQARDEGRNWVKLIQQKKADEYDKLFAEEKVELGDLPVEVFRMMRAYHQTYLEVDKAYQTIRCEQDFMIRIPNTNFVITGRIDKIALHIESGKIWVFEHKTMAKGIPVEDFRTTDIQTAVYSWVMDQIVSQLGDYTKDMIGGVMFDYIRTKPPTIPSTLKNGQLSQAKIDCDRWTYLACIKKAELDPSDYEEFLKRLDENMFFRRIPMAKSPAMIKLVMRNMVNVGIQIEALGRKCIVRNLNWTCDRPKCEYRDLCIAELQGADTESLIKIQFERGFEDSGKIVEDESDN